MEFTESPPPAETQMLASHWLDVVTWLLWPLIFAIGCWAILLLPDVLEKLLPWPLERELANQEAAVAASANGSAERSLLNRSGSDAPLTLQEKTLLPPDRYSAWVAGRAAGRLEDPEVAVDDHLHDVAEVIGVSADLIDRDTVIHLGDLIQVADRRRPGSESIQRLQGFFTLVNCMWIVAILGLVFTVWPFLDTVARPPMQWLLHHILVPLYRFLGHLEPLWELCAFLACLYITALGLCYRRGVREWVALSGLGLSMAAYSYITDDIDGDIMSPGLAYTWFYGYLTLAAVPVAKRFDSEMLGFFASLALFGTLDAWIIPSITHGVLAAWDMSYVEIVNVSGASFIVAGILLVLKLLHRERSYGPYRLGLYIFGPVLFFATWLMLASYWLMPGTHLFWLKYIIANAALVLLLAVSVAFGMAVDFKSLTNTSITFGVLWMFTKVIDASAVFGDGANYVVAFFTFLAMWLAAWFLKNNPTWAQSLLP